MKSIMNPRAWMIVASSIALLMVGIGPMTASSGDITEMSEDDFGDLYTNASAEDKVTIEDSVEGGAYFFGAANISFAVFILGFAFLTEGRTRAKSAIFCGGATILFAIYSMAGWDGGTFYSVISVPMIIAGVLHLNSEEVEETGATSE